MVTSTEFTKEQELELTRILGVNERWGGVKVADELAATTIDKSFDHPVVSNKVNRNNSTVNDKYIFLIKVFFAVREECFKGNLGTTTKGDLKQLQSIEKFEKVFMLRFTNSRPQFYSFKKASEVSGLTLAQINNIKAKSNGKYEGIRFDINTLLDLIEPSTKVNWDKDISKLTVFSTTEETNVVTDMFYLEKMMELSEHYAFRKLCTYESQRLNPSNIDYANLTVEGKLLPDWYVHFKQDTYFTLLRKEQLVAFFNNYDDIYNSLPTDYQFTLEPATQETINAHKLYTKRNNYNG